jgi:hypothetical protein
LVAAPSSDKVHAEAPHGTEQNPSRQEMAPVWSIPSLLVSWRGLRKPQPWVEGEPQDAGSFLLAETKPVPTQRSGAACTETPLILSKWVRMGHLIDSVTTNP